MWCLFIHARQRIKILFRRSDTAVVSRHVKTKMAGATIIPPCGDKRWPHKLPNRKNSERATPNFYFCNRKRTAFPSKWYMGIYKYPGRKYRSELWKCGQNACKSMGQYLLRWDHKRMQPISYLGVFSGVPSCHFTFKIIHGIKYQQALVRLYSLELFIMFLV